MPLQKLLNKLNMFQWMEEVHNAFGDLNNFLTSHPIFIAPMEKNPLLLYIEATTKVASIALVVERKEEDMFTCLGDGLFHQ